MCLLVIISVNAHSRIRPRLPSQRDQAPPKPMKQMASTAADNAEQLQARAAELAMEMNHMKPWLRKNGGYCWILEELTFTDQKVGSVLLDIIGEHGCELL